MTKISSTRRRINKDIYQQPSPTKKTISCSVCGIQDGKYKCPKCRLPYCSVTCCKDHKGKCLSKSSTNCDDNTVKSSLINDCKTTTFSKYLPSDALNKDPYENASLRRKMLEDDDDDIEEEGWKITREMMDKIDNSTWLRNELSDGGLRQIIYEIDSADDSSPSSQTMTNNTVSRRKNTIFGCNNENVMTAREKALEHAKATNPKFARFIDKLLLSVGVLVKEGDSSNQEGLDACLQALLRNDCDSSEGNDAIDHMERNIILAPVQKVKRGDLHANIEDGNVNDDDDDDDDAIDDTDLLDEDEEDDSSLDTSTKSSYTSEDDDDVK